MDKSLEERIIDLERRLLPIATFLYEKYGKEIETIKLDDIERNGTLYKIKYTIETDKGTKDIVIEVKGYSDKQAMFIGNRDIIYPQMSRLQSDGKISWFKTINKQLLNK